MIGQFDSGDPSNSKITNDVTKSYNWIKWFAR